MSNGKDDGAGKVLLAAGVAGGTAALVARLLAGKPALAAPVEEKWDYLLESQETIVRLLQELIAARAEVAVSVSTPWVAKDPEQIYSYAIRSIGTFYTDRMVDWTRGKRFLFKIESSLDVDCDVQVIGNFVENIPMASNVNGIINIAADENHTIGLAWDDWHPFVGIRITTAVAPGAGILTIWAVIQE